MATDLDLARTVAEVVTDAELNILKLIRNRLAKGQDSPQWAVTKLAELQEVRQQVITELRVLNADLAVSIEGVLSQAYMNSALSAYQGLTSAGIIAGLPSATNAAITALASDITAKVTGLAPRVLRSTVDAYQQAVGASLGNLILGVETRRQTTQQVINRLLGQGITSFTDKAGRNWGLDSYAEMATRTGLGEARLLGHTQTLTDAGQDLVYVIPGPRACPECDYWIGKVLSLTGATVSTPEVKVDATLDEARSAGHLFGPNCRCVTGIYLPGFTTLPTTHQDTGGYESQQKQRYFERRIREAKRLEALALSPEEAKKMKVKVRERQAKLRAHLEVNPQLKRQSHREQVKKVV